MFTPAGAFGTLAHVFTFPLSLRRNRLAIEQEQAPKRLLTLQAHGAAVLWHVAPSNVALRVLMGAWKQILETPLPPMRAEKRSSQEHAEEHAERADKKPSILDGYCSQGFRSPNSPICCAGSCGQCGGDGCRRRNGGSESCCLEGIMAANVTCSSPTQTVCVLRESSHEDKARTKADSHEDTTGVLHFDPNDPDIPVS